jgi:HSP20 family protein
MDERYSYLGRVVTVEYSRQLGYFGHIILDMRTEIEPCQWFPNTTIYETNDDVIILVELAGLRNEDVDVVVQGNQLIVSGERLLPISQPSSVFHNVEIPTGTFQKVIRFSCPIAVDLVRRAMRDGLLEIRVPKAGLVP